MPTSTTPETSNTPSHIADLRLLHAASLQRSGGWLAEALAAEGVPLSEIDEAVGVTATLARLRERSFDAVVVSHEPGALDGAELVEGLRIAGQDEAVVVLVDHPEAEVEILCHEAGADAVCPVAHATARSLVAAVRRAVQSRHVLRDNRHLQQAEQQRLAAEHRDAEQTLADQRRLVEQLVSLTDAGASASADASDPSGPGPVIHPTPQAAAPADDLPEEFNNHYQDLLRAYVIMGAGNLAAEIDKLAGLLAAAGVSAERVIRLHLMAVERLLAGLGRRSVRHVMNRADLLVLELVAKMADGYRLRYHERAEPPRQLTLPGFESLPPEPPPTVYSPLDESAADAAIVDTRAA